MVFGPRYIDNELFKGINRFRLHDYQLLLAKAYDTKFTSKKQKDYLREKLKKIRTLSKNLKGRNEILMTLHEIEDRLKDADYFYSEEDNKLLMDLLTEIRNLHEKVDQNILQRESDDYKPSRNSKDSFLFESKKKKKTTKTKSSVKKDKLSDRTTSAKKKKKKT